MRKKLLMFACSFLFNSIEESCAMCSDSVHDKLIIDAATALVEFRNVNTFQSDNKRAKTRKIHTPMSYKKGEIVKIAMGQFSHKLRKKNPITLQLSAIKKEKLLELLSEELPYERTFSSILLQKLQEKSRRQFLDCARDLLKLSKERKEQVNKIQELQKLLDTSTSTIKEMNIEKIALYDEINKILSTLERTRDKLFELEIHEMSKRRFVTNISQELKTEEKKLEEIKARSKKIRDKEYNHFILLKSYEALGNLPDHKS